MGEVMEILSVGARFDPGRHTSFGSLTYGSPAPLPRVLWVVSSGGNSSNSSRGLLKADDNLRTRSFLRT